MTVEEILEALQLQAVGSRDASGPGLADVIWRSRHEAETLDLQAIWHDLVQLLQELRSEALVWQETGVPIAFSYAVAEVASRAASLGLSAPDSDDRGQGILLCWRLSTGWEALMAGDVDDIAEHVRNEEWALQLGSARGDESPD